MKRYQFGLLIVCLGAAGCSKQPSESEMAAKQAAGAEQTAQQAAEQSQEAAATAQRAADQAEGMERPELPPPSDQSATAASGSEVYERRTPGSGTTPGTTKAVEPGEGTTTGSAQATNPAVDQPIAGADNRNPPVEQGTSQSDRQMTQRIRRAMIEDDTLSFTAKNAQIITRDGHVWLRGLVQTDIERRRIEDLARSYAAGGNVTNQLEVRNQVTPMPTE